MDERTIQAARAGDRTALASLLRELQDPWYRFSLTLLSGDSETAREATQETGLRFLKALPAFRGDSQLQTWSLGKFLNFNGAAQFLALLWPFFTLWFLFHPMHRVKRQ